MLGEYKGHSQAGQPMGARSIALLSDKKTLISYGMDGTFRTWDVKTFVNRSANTFPGRWKNDLGLLPAAWMPLCIAPDGSRVATIGREARELALWKADMTGDPTILAGDRKISCYVSSPDGNSILLGYKDGTIQRLDFQGKAIEPSFEGHDSLVHGMAVAPSGGVLISVSYDRSIRLWGIHTGANTRSWTWRFLRTGNC